MPDFLRRVVGRLRGRGSRPPRPDARGHVSHGSHGSHGAAAAAAGGDLRREQSGASRQQEPKRPPAPADPIVAAVREQRLTYLPVGALNDLFTAAQEADRQQRPGILLEAGCALGGSALVLAKGKQPARPLFIHDVFGMIPPPTETDGLDVHARYQRIVSGQAAGLGGDSYYGYESDLLDKVRETFDRFGLAVDENSVHLVKGLFQDTIVGTEPVAVAHIDGDWYESVLTCLERIGPRLPPGGIMVIDDYFKWSGCRTAVDEFLAKHAGEYRTVRRTRLHIVKAPAAG